MMNGLPTMLFLNLKSTLDILNAVKLVSSLLSSAVGAARIGLKTTNYTGCHNVHYVAVHKESIREEPQLCHIVNELDKANYLKTTYKDIAYTTAVM